MSRGVLSGVTADRDVALSTDVYRTGVRAVRTVGVRNCGGRCAPSAVSRTATDGPRGRWSGLDAGRRAGRASVCAPGGSATALGGCGQRRAGVVMGRVAVRESVTLAGRAERARAARAFVSEMLGPGHPCGDAAVLLVSEVFSNSVRHSGSGAPGQTVTVTVIAGDRAVRVEVTDRAGPGTPGLRPADRDAEGGRGLQLVARLAVRWGWRRRGGRMVTWFVIQALLRAMRHSAVSGKGFNLPDVDVSGS